MFGLQRFIQVGWLLITVSLVMMHVYLKWPCASIPDVAAGLGLLALSIRAVLGVSRWADLAWRKVWLWITNSSVNWTMEVRIAVPDEIEDADVSVLEAAIRTAREQDRVSRPHESEIITLETAQNYIATIRPLHSHGENRWIIRFNPVHIGYRDASTILQRVFVPIIDELSTRIENAGNRQYAIEARFNGTNPYAAVLLNELRAKSADQVLVSFQQDGSRVQVTRTSVISSSDSQTSALHAMSTVFGLSLRGAFVAGNA